MGWFDNGLLARMFQSGNPSQQAQNTMRGGLLNSTLTGDSIRIPKGLPGAYSEVPVWGGQPAPAAGGLGGAMGAMGAQQQDQQAQMDEQMRQEISAKLQANMQQSMAQSQPKGQPMPQYQFQPYASGPPAGRQATQRMGMPLGGMPPEMGEGLDPTQQGLDPLTQRILMMQRGQGGY